ncbi:MAG: hypothetical protein WC284_14365 [Candidimonas sp.]
MNNNDETFSVFVPAEANDEKPVYEDIKLILEKLRKIEEESEAVYGEKFVEFLTSVKYFAYQDLLVFSRKLVNDFKLDMSAHEVCIKLIEISEYFLNQKPKK